MKNTKPEKEPLDNIVGDLRDEYMHQSPTLTNSETPKSARARRLRPGHWLLILTALLILASVTVTLILSPTGKSQTAATDSEPRGVVEGVTLENWEEYIDPTFPAMTAIPLPEEEEIEPIPVEPTPALPEVTPWPTPPITPPENQ